MTREIPLTQGYVAIVDDDMYEYLMQWKWTYSNGYAVRADKSGWSRGQVLMHRVVAQAPDGIDVDHKDLDRLNCTRENLRLASRSQNGANRPATKRNTTGYKGVQPSGNAYKRPYRAEIRFLGKNIYLGSFETAEEAARAYDAKAVELFGEFAYTNFK